jgi:lipopolysaccharide biosynthesis glycosyltransferase
LGTWARGPLVASAADEGYVVPLAAAFRSLLDHATAGERPGLVVLDGGISPASRERLLDSWTGAAGVEFIAPTGEPVDSLPLRYSYTTRTTFLRLLLPDLLPASCERVLYLDPDVLVSRDPSELWSLDLGGMVLAAATEMYAPVVSCDNGLGSYRELGLDPGTPYFNAGVLVIDTGRWRGQGIGTAAIEHVRRFRPYHQDQDGLNAAVAGRFRELHPSWNVSRYWDREERRRGVFADLPAEARILHFLGPDKPWHAGSAVPAWKRERFFDCVDRTAWRGWRPG